MKSLSLFFICFWMVTTAVSQSATEISIIPQPVSLEKKSARFVLNNQTKIVSDTRNADVQRIVRSFTNQARKATGFTMAQAAPATKANVISFSLNRSPDKVIGKEGYTIDVTATGVQVAANDAAGLFYAVQTLFQLLPKEIESQTVVKKTNWVIPGVQITDYPRFAWRGLMFDVVRHFFTKEQVKQYIDEMVKYKYNLLHLHLTDDQGWRVEIKSLPKLTEVGAWRVDKTGTFGTFTPPTENEPRTYGGFYTHNDIKELVQYAADRFVNILPEVDVPGHSMAAVAAYPELSCTPGTYRVSSGEKFMQWTDTGFYALVDNTLCPANDKVYEVLDKVFTEVAQLFPFEYIHMGGDECAKNFWEKSEAVKQLMQKEGLKDLHEVQSYFVKKVEKIIESKGKKMIGWDEILEGGLAPNAAVMSWRGSKGGAEAAKMQHEVVMSPNNNTYIDLMQGDAAIEPPVYKSVRLKDSYKFEPVPEGVDPRFIKGGQANLWTEQIYNMRHAQYMTWPRAFAVAECVWSPAAKKNWNDFIRRVEDHFERFNVAEIKYAPSMYDPIFDVSKDGDQLKLAMSTEVEGLDIYYSFDNSFPDRFYPKYTQPVKIPIDAQNVKVITYRGKEPIGRMITITVADLKKRADKKK
ncbi:beta-N-acetylhexosaminidase [Niastella caeni]|uniref:beta-N-acetylhexosaminidase n=1 Tax=Niastella caeni TaxID=2569763 RepID=A0A4S8HWS1_9BACT|nr:family 20 glycosylhydrolase [Niastella caeni]THU40080.1 beta-N-acetylhexosaminidase [Niastella caeni]